MHSVGVVLPLLLVFALAFWRVTPTTVWSSIYSVFEQYRKVVGELNLSSS